MKCNICSKTPFHIGGFLETVNKKGERGIFECRPSCDADLSQDTKLVMALDWDDSLTYKSISSDEDRTG